MSSPTTVIEFPQGSSRAHALDKLVESVPALPGVRARDLAAGDWVVVRTRNSVYTLSVVGDGSYLASGGWFAARGLEATPVGIAGCTWGGSAILSTLVAAPGMCLEFSNRVTTTRIRSVQVFRGEAGQRPH